MVIAALMALLNVLKVIELMVLAVTGRLFDRFACTMIARHSTLPDPAKSKPPDADLQALADETRSKAPMVRAATERLKRRRNEGIA